MLQPTNPRSWGFRSDGDSHFQVGPMIFDWVQVRLWPGSDSTDLSPTLVCVLRVIAMFMVNLFASLVSSKHEGLSPEWWSYRTRECCFSQSQRHLCDFIWLLLRRSLLNPRLLTFWNFLPSQVAQTGGTNFCLFRMVERRWRDEKMHMMADRDILNILV